MLAAYYPWDGLTLLRQTRRSAGAPREAGTAVESAYLAERDHISERVRIVEDDDVTARLVLAFLRQN